MPEFTISAKSQCPWGPLAAAALLAEIGDDMERFGQARRLANWVGMCPGRRESAGMRRLPFAHKPT